MSLWEILLISNTAKCYIILQINLWYYIAVTLLSQYSIFKWITTAQRPYSALSQVHFLEYRTLSDYKWSTSDTLSSLFQGFLGPSDFSSSTFHVLFSCNLRAKVVTQDVSVQWLLIRSFLTERKKNWAENWWREICVFPFLLINS